MSAAGLRFIPLRSQDLVQALQRQLAADEAGAWQRFAQLLDSLLHMEGHRLQQAFKHAYALQDPNSDTVTLDGLPASAGPSIQELLAEVLDQANYEPVSAADLEHALHESSLFQVRLQVDFDEFEEVLLFCRGASERRETLRSWWGLRRRQVRFTNYERVVVYLKFRSDLDTEHPLCRPGSTMLKLFQNVPRADLEMLFPNTRVRMRLRDKLVLGVPAAVGGGVVVSTKLGGSLLLLASLAGYWLGAHDTPVELDQAALLALLAGVGALAAHFWKQFNNFKNRKLRFVQALTRNLYFKNLDNNAGVFYRLLDEAEEEESKEALLAYFMLWRNASGLTAAQLDERVEQWLWQSIGREVDFEIDDALAKLERYRLVECDAGTYRAVAIGEALRRMDHRWDNLFPYANSSA